MKKNLIAFLVLIAFSATGISQAVTTPGKKTDNKMKVVFPAKPTTSSKLVQMPKPLSKTPDLQKTKTVEPTTPIVLKKDGTPDMRYKLNKKGK